MMVARLGGSPAGPSAPAMSGGRSHPRRRCGLHFFLRFLNHRRLGHSRLQLKGRSSWLVGENPSLFRGGARVSVSGKGGVSDT
jgi:hypothetical protein